VDRHRVHSGAPHPGLEQALTDLGDALLRDAPAVALRDAVLRRMADTPRASHPWDDGPLLLAYREGALDAAGVAGLEARLAGEPHLRDMLRQLDAIEAVLHVTGDAIDDANAGVDLRDAVRAGHLHIDVPRHLHIEG